MSKTAERALDVKSILNRPFRLIRDLGPLSCPTNDVLVSLIASYPSVGPHANRGSRRPDPHVDCPGSNAVLYFCGNAEDVSQSLPTLELPFPITPYLPSTTAATTAAPVSRQNKRSLQTLWRYSIRSMRVTIGSSQSVEASAPASRSKSPAFARLHDSSSSPPLRQHAGSCRQTLPPIPRPLAALR
jgi:hypothetical protein